MQLMSWRKAAPARCFAAAKGLLKLRRSLQPHPQCPQLPVQGSTVPGQPHSVAASSCRSASPAGLQQGTALHSAEPQQLWPEPISLLPFPSPALPSPHHWVKSTQEIQHMGKDGANKPPLASFPLGLGLLKKGVWDVIAFPWGVIGAVGCLRTSPSLPYSFNPPSQPKTGGGLYQGQLYKP